MGYASYNTIPVGRYRKYCGLDRVCLRIRDFSGELKLEYLYSDGSKEVSCIGIGDNGSEIDFLDAELLRISA